MLESKAEEMPYIETGAPRLSSPWISRTFSPGTTPQQEPHTVSPPAGSGVANLLTSDSRVTSPAAISVLDMAIYTPKQRLDNRDGCPPRNPTGTSLWNSPGNKVGWMLTTSQPNSTECVCPEDSADC